MLGLAHPGLGSGVEAARIRRVLHETDGAAERTGSIQSALRAPQNFHVIEVVQPQIDEQRRIVHVGRDRRHDRRRESDGAAGRFAVQTTNDELRAIDAAERPLVGEVHPRHRLRQAGDVVDPGSVERGTAHGRDAHRQILRRRRAARGRDDDLLQRIVGGQGGIAIEGGQDRSRERSRRRRALASRLQTPEASRREPAVVLCASPSRAVDLSKEAGHACNHWSFSQPLDGAPSGINDFLLASLLRRYASTASATHATVDPPKAASTTPWYPKVSSSRPPTKGPNAVAIAVPPAMSRARFPDRFELCSDRVGVGEEWGTG